MATQLADIGQATLADLLAVAIQLEAGAQRFYEGLARMFAHCPDVAEFWRRFAADETLHEKQLIDFRASMSVKRLSEPADAQLLEAGRKVLSVTLEERLSELQNLDDAWQMAHDLEVSETNTIFRFFMAEFSRDKRIVAAMMQHLDEHAERLMTGLPPQYATRAARAAVPAMRS
jgi:rubrerythrin